jgi:hypothetical protein
MSTWEWTGAYAYNAINSGDSVAEIQLDSVKVDVRAELEILEVLGTTPDGKNLSLDIRTTFPGFNPDPEQPTFNGVSKVVYGLGEAFWPKSGSEFIGPGKGLYVKITELDPPGGSNTYSLIIRYRVQFVEGVSIEDKRAIFSDIIWSSNPTGASASGTEARR